MDIKTMTDIEKALEALKTQYTLDGDRSLTLEQIESEFGDEAIVEVKVSTLINAITELSKPSFEEAVKIIQDEIAREEKNIAEYKAENDGAHPVIYEAYKNAFELMVYKLKGLSK